MSKKITSPHRMQPDTGSDKASNKAKSSKPEPKINRLLIVLIWGMSLNRFEAENEPGVEDHVLPSTISDIQRRFGLTVSRMMEKAPGYNGEPTWVCRYWLTREERKRACLMLGLQISEVTA